MGGSAYTMSRDIADGYCSVTERTFKTMTPADLNGLSHEMDRYLRELRGQITPTEDQVALQTRNRRIVRLNTALTVLRAFRMKVRR